MKVEEKIRKMEQAKGQNRPLSQLRSLLDHYLPEHKNIEKIQVVGTNGKGSTSLWMASLAARAGFQCGLFTSPHLIEHYERIQINGIPIDAHSWETIYDRWALLFHKHKFTMFEMDLWMALDYFIASGVDLAIMEAGLGGRLDATTALDYEALCITNAGMDHMDYLGSSIEQIIREKAGAMKPGVPVICGETDPARRRLFQRYAARAHAPFIPASLKGQKDTYTAEIQHKSHWLHFDLVRLPQYQLNNFSMAYTVFKTLEYPLLVEDVQGVIDEFQWPGRFQMLSAQPYILLDGAHNVPGMEALVKSLIAFDGDIYFSALKDKNLPEMIRILKKLDCPITLVSFESSRRADLRRISRQLQLPLVSFEEMMEDLKTRRRPALVCGSLYFAGSVLQAWPAANREER